ncbi:fractalkine isoform 2-T2 [Callospermophilus lateralis]|uniref:fractalkine isoform X2 n=1 Tax=Callospermophilus lateralis TaxID=76772 RepID=UPI004054001C
MAPTPLAWLLSLATLCHLTILVAGQHHGVTKCNITCNTMTRPIPVTLLIGYWKNPESCGRRAVVLETKRHKYFCADPKEKWVQEAMKHLNRSAQTQSGGTFEKQIGSEPTITPATTEGQSRPAFSEPEATGEGNSLEMTTSSQEAQRSMGTSPKLPVGTTDSSGYRSTPTSKAPEERPPAGPGSTEPIGTAVASTTVAQQSQTGPGLRVIKAHSEAHSTQVLSTEPPSTQTPDMSYPALEETTLSKGQPASGKGQTPSPETSPGPEETSPVSTPREASPDSGPGKMAHAPVVPVSSEGTPSQEPVASGSWAPKTKEPIHTQSLRSNTPGPQEATRRQAVGLLAFLGLLFCLGVAMFAYQSLQGCPRKMAGEMVEGLRYVPRSCGSNSYVLVPV